ncbi:MAG: von Willebrand factor type A domain-containing protein [Planctomycetota bacterium]
MTSQQSNHDDLHSRLCAHLFGELSPEEAKELEQRLEHDPELRAERARLAATINVVQETYREGASLPGDRKTALIAAARQAARGFQPARRSRIRLVAAAAAAAILLASAVYLGMPGFPTESPETRVAVDLPRESITVNPPVSAVLSIASSEAPAAESTVALVQTPNTGTYKGPGDAVSPSAGVPASLTQDELDRLRQFGYMGGGGAGGAAPARPSAGGPSTPEPQRIPGTKTFLIGTMPPKSTSAVIYSNTLGAGFYSGMGRKEALAEATRRRPVITAAQILADCSRRQGETPRMMYFRFYGDNQFELAELDRFSTFAADVDTASYALARNYLSRGLVPEKAQVRTEEFVNYFKPDLAPPEEGALAIQMEAAKSLFGGDDSALWMLRVTLCGKEVAAQERAPQRLTFVIDTSGSMKEENRLEMVKHALRLLLTQLDGRDRVSIVTFSSDASLRLPMTAASDRATIEEVLYSLQPDGSTNAEAGLKLGFEQALGALDGEGSENRVILLSDGVANVGVTDQDRISDDVAACREKGIYLNTVGVGMGNHNDVFLERLADRGDGVCNYIDSPKEAKRALVDNFCGAMIPIARDVKIQVEFDPQQVRRYRLLGYENRAIADRDFRNDAVDAGEIGSGHQVCALFEIEPVTQLRQEPVPFATARVRYKPPHGQGDEVTELSQLILVGEVLNQYELAGPGYRRSVLVAQFAEFLRRSRHARGDSLDLLVHEAKKLEKELNDPDFTEFSALADASRELILRNLPAGDPLTEAIDAVRKNSVLRAELEELSQAGDRELLEQLERENQKLEARIQELLDQRNGRK